MLRLAGNFRRLQFISARVRLLSTAQPQPDRKVSKEALIKLRQKTGYSYVNCRKALVQFGEENIDDALKWLKELAEKEGWAKATKLSKRAVSQGLVGIHTEGNVGALIEVNCETDFVARSDDFRHLVNEITQAVFAAGKEWEAEKAPPDEKEIVLIPIDVEHHKTSKGRTIKEAVAATVGKLGENVVLKRADVLLAKPGVQIYGATDLVAMGQYVSLLAMGRGERPSEFPTDKLAAQICQHIIGMKPDVLGLPADENSAEKPRIVKRDVVDEPEDELNAFASVDTPYIDEDENQLLRQSFLHSPSQSVHDYLTSHAAEVHWFIRHELGVPEKTDPPPPAEDKTEKP